MCLVCRKFDIVTSDTPIRFLMESDGCEVDPKDFQLLLEPQVPIMVLKPSESWTEATIHA